jgi:shikimate kinase
MLERRAGVPAATLARRGGIDALHRAEAAVLRDALTGASPAVVAAAASTIEDPEVRAALRHGAYVVWLRADPDVLVARLPSPTRPFGDQDPARLVAEQARRRDPLFAQVADVTVETGREPVAATVARALDAIERGTESLPG